MGEEKDPTLPDNAGAGDRDATQNREEDAGSATVSRKDFEEMEKRLMATLTRAVASIRKESKPKPPAEPKDEPTSEGEGGAGGVGAALLNSMKRQLDEMRREREQEKREAEEARRIGAIREAVNALNLGDRTEAVFRFIRDDVRKDDDGSLVAELDGQVLPLQEYVAEVVSRSAWAQPPKPKPGAGGVPQSAKPAAGTKADQYDDKMSPEANLLKAFKAGSTSSS